MEQRLIALLYWMSVILFALALLLAVAFVTTKLWSGWKQATSEAILNQLKSICRKQPFLRLARRFSLLAIRVLAVRLKTGDPYASELFYALNGFDRIRRLATSRAVHRRIRAAELLGLLPFSEETSRILSVLVADAHPLVREAAIRAISFRGDAPAAETMMRFFQRYRDVGPYRLVRQALRSCGNRITPTLIGGLSSPIPEVRWLSLDVLGDLGDPRALPFVLELADPGSDLETLVRATRALRRFRGDLVIARLLELTSHPSWEVRAQAARSLGFAVSSDDAPRTESGTGERDGVREAVIEQLRELAYDPEYWVRNNAITALGRLGSRGQSVLRQIASGLDRYSAERAREELGRLYEWSQPTKDVGDKEASDPQIDKPYSNTVRS